MPNGLHLAHVHPVRFISTTFRVSGHYGAPAVVVRLTRWLAVVLHTGAGIPSRRFSQLNCTTLGVRTVKTAIVGLVVPEGAA